MRFISVLLVLSTNMTFYDDDPAGGG